MASDWVVLDEFPYTTRAEEARAILEEAGIASELEGVNVNTMLPYLGTALGVKLRVASADVNAARQVLESPNELPTEAGSPWRCGKCQLEVEPGYDRCWSCGGERSEVEAVAPVGAAASVAPLPDDSPTVADQLVTRAWRAAVLGSVCLPVFLHVLALFLLSQAATCGTPMSERSRRLAMLSLGLSVIASTFWIVILGFSVAL
jgi:hypothetical protein